MPITKRLFIKASNSYDKGFQIVPVNTEQPLEVNSDIGLFKLYINIKNSMDLNLIYQTVYTI